MAWGTGTLNDGNIDDDGFVQFAEKFFTKLVKTPDTDAFYRPANTWSYDKETIGTYVDWTLMVAEYTTAVSGKEVYGVIGKTAFDKFDFSAYVDGTADDMYKQIGKDNKDDIKNTDDGALTQVFVDSDNKTVVVTVINTYLAQATADYNSKKDTATFTVYGVTGDKTVSGEDFDVADVEEDDFVLVTYSYAEKAIQTIEDVEILSDVEITTFSTSGATNTVSGVSSVTVDGTKYDDSAKLVYDPEVLEKYVNSNLKDTTFNVYLDKYGYVIGVDIVDTVDNYVFITGVDDASSNLATATWTANAIFLDGTSDVITIKNNGAVAQSPLVNSWFTYTVNSSNVYTLTKVADALSADDDVAQHRTYQGKVSKIDSTHIWLNGDDRDGKIYGNDDTVYLIAEMDTVKVGKDFYGVIKGVDEMVVGIDNVAIEVWSDVITAGKLSTSTTQVSATNTVGGTFALYDDDGYVIAAVVIGEGSSVTNSIAFSLKDGITSESYSKADDLWTWTTDVVINGEKVTLTEKNDENDSEIKNNVTKEYVWLNVKYDADGNVKAIEKLNAASTVAKYVTGFNDAVKAIEADEDLVVLDVVPAVKGYHISGKTLYQTTSTTTGIRVAEDVNIVLIQTVNSKETTTYDAGVTTLKNMLEDLNEVDTKTGNNNGYNFDAVIEDGRITSVIIEDLNKDTAYDGANGATVTSDVALVSFNATLRTIVLEKTEKSTKVDVENAIKVALADNGYTWTDVKVADDLSVSSVKAVPTASVNNATVVEFSVTVK